MVLTAAAVVVLIGSDGGRGANYQSGASSSGSNSGTAGKYRGH